MAGVEDMQASHLTEGVAPAQCTYMTRTVTIIAIAVAAALAGCQQENHNLTNERYDPMADALANAGPVELPPAIRSSKTYRCRGDNSLVYIDWLADGSAQFRAEQGTTPVRLRAEEPGEPLTADGYVLEGTAEGSTITIAVPDAGERSCHT